MARPFELRGSETLVETPIFTLRRDIAAHPETGAEAPYFVLDSPDWVNVVPETTDGGIVLVRQWRHGAREVELELPAGLVDEGETAMIAGPRELREETGYVSDSWHDIGSILPNPAYQDNRCTTLLAEACRKAGEAQPDHDEDIETLLVRAADVRDLVRNGQLRNSVVISALLWWLDFRGLVRWP